MNMERRKSSFERVVGNISETQKGEILQEKEEGFDNQIFGYLKGKEREKTPEELQVIALANDMTNEIRRQYGLDDFDVPANNIHIVRKEHWPEERADSEAYYSSMLQAVVSLEDDEKILLMKKTLHEMLHFKSYNAIQSTKEERPYIKGYRVGLTVTERSGNNIYLGSLNEAVTEEMVKRFVTKNKNYLRFLENPLFSEEIKKSQEIIAAYHDAKNIYDGNIFTEDTFYANIKKVSEENSDGSQPTRIHLTAFNFAYSRERKNLNMIINKIFERNPGQFNSQEEIFDIFAKAMMTGNILPIGKLMDKTFGRGTFDKFTELDKSGLSLFEDPRKAEKQDKFIESL